MDRAHRLEQLVMKWKEQFDNGVPTSAADLCRECPELVDDLQSQIDAHKWMEMRYVESPAELAKGASPPTNDFPAERQDLESSNDASTNAPTPSNLAGIGEESLTQIGRFPIEARLGEGGMGVVYRVRDASLNRHLAVKVLKNGLQHDADLRRRFLDESQVMGQMQHPGIAPIHEVGTLDDGRPFFSMKQIQGQTLASLLNVPGKNGANLSRFLAIFEQVCHTMAYAHSQGIIHRDLKPANIMVGAFGEVQVMDWGLAKRMKDESGRMNDDNCDSRPLSFDNPTPETEHGVAMGTPAYMAPEQARGETENIDERADVFGLGAILAEILTGKPPFWTNNRVDVLRMAQQAEIGDVCARLDDCGADAELRSLCKTCLMPERVERLRNAGKVADAVEAYQTGVREKLRNAELETAQAQIKSVEERKRRHWMVAALLALLLLVAGGAGGAIWYQQVQSTRAAEIADQKQKQIQRERDEQHRLENTEARIQEALKIAVQEHDNLTARLTQSKAGVFELLDDPAQWQLMIDKAWSAFQRAEDLSDGVKNKISPQLRKQLVAMRSTLQQDYADRNLALQLEQERFERSKWTGERFNRKASLKNYPKIFADAGFLIANGDLPAVVAAIKRSAVKEQLLAALEDWANVADQDGNEKLATRLLELARQAGPDPWNDRLRDPKLWRDRLALVQFAELLLKTPAKFAQLSPQTMDWIGSRLHFDRVVAERWYRQAQALNPDDFWLNYGLAETLRDAGKLTVAAGFYRVAIAARPKNSAAWNNLGGVLNETKEYDAAVFALERAIEIDPKHVRALTHLANVLRQQRKFQPALKRLEQVKEIDPSFPPLWMNYGLLLMDQENFDEATIAYKKALALQPGFAGAWSNLGVNYARQGENKKAEEAHRMVLKIDPRDAHALTSLGVILADQGRLDDAITYYRKALEHHPRYAPAWNHIGSAYFEQNKLNAAIAAYQKSLALAPRSAESWNGLGMVLRKQQKFSEAVAAFEKAIEIDPNHAPAYGNYGALLCDNYRQYHKAETKFRHALNIRPNYLQVWYNLGVALHAQNRSVEAEAAYKKALSINSRHGAAWTNLGNILKYRGEIDGAATAYRKAIAVEPNLPPPRYGLAGICHARGEFQEALQLYRKYLSLIPKKYHAQHSATKQIRLCERLLALEEKLPAVLAGKGSVSLSDQLALAELCRRYKKRYLDSVHLFSSVFKQQPNLADVLQEHHRYHAACAAVRAAAGDDENSEVLSSKAKTKLRQQALAWLTSDLKAYSNLLNRKPSSAVLIQEELMRSQSDAVLSSVREKTQLARLPADEQQAWQKFWGNLEGFKQKVRGSYVEKVLNGTLTDDAVYRRHELKLNTGKIYVIKMQSKQLDTLLAIEDSQGKKLAENDDIDSGKNLDSQLTFTPIEDGDYRILATSYQQRGRGNYEIRISEFAKSDD